MLQNDERCSEGRKVIQKRACGLQKQLSLQPALPPKPSLLPAAGPAAYLTRPLSDLCTRQFNSLSLQEGSNKKREAFSWTSFSKCHCQHRGGTSAGGWTDGSREKEEEEQAFPFEATATLGLPVVLVSQHLQKGTTQASLRVPCPRDDEYNGKWRNNMSGFMWFFVCFPFKFLNGFFAS